MISNPSLLTYTCVAKGTVVLAEFVSKEDSGIKEVALRCIENTPLHHSMFSHTVQRKTYTFSIDDDDSFVYFAIFEEGMEKPESFWLLNRLRSAIEDLIRGGGSDVKTLIDPAPHCLQSKLDPVFAEIVGGVDLDLMGSPMSVVAREIRDPSIDSSKGRRVALMPLLGKPLKKKRLHTKAKGEEDSDEVASTKNGSNGVLRKEQRNGLLTDHHRQKAKQMWKKHVWMVLLFDFCVCALLFGIWLWVCDGFQCING